MHKRESKEKITNEQKNKEVEQLEEELKSLQQKNQKLTNKITLIKTSMNMDGLNRFFYFIPQYLLK